MAKQIGEPLISLAIGSVLRACGYDEGKYFAFGAAVLFINQTMIDAYNERRSDDMRDGMIEGHYIMDKSR